MNKTVKCFAESNTKAKVGSFNNALLRHKLTKVDLTVTDPESPEFLTAALSDAKAHFEHRGGLIKKGVPIDFYTLTATPSTNGSGEAIRWRILENE